MNYILETKNLIIKTTKIPQDVEEFCDIMNQHSRMSQFMTWEPPIKKEYLIKKLEDQIKKGDLPFSIFFKDGDTKLLAGEVVLRNLVWSQQNTSKNSAFLSFWISPEFGGKGLGTEMLEEICNFSFKVLGLRKLLAGCFIGNIGSQKLLEKLQFRKIGLSHHHYLKNHKWIDSLRYELLSRKFLSEKDELKRKKIHKKPILKKFDSMSEISFDEDEFEIRTLKNTDSKIILKALNKFPEIQNFKIWTMPKSEPEVMEKIIKVKHSKNLNLGIFKNNEFLGRIYLSNFRFEQEDSIKNSAFLYFWFTPEVSEKDVLKLLDSFLSYSFRILKFRKIFAPVFSKDRNSQNILLESDFSLIGFWEDHYEKNGKFYDSMRYEILNPELDREVD